MNLLVLNAFGATEPNAEENLSRVARDDVNLTVENISAVFPLDYNTYRYNLLKCANATVERIITAETDGYDGVLISCNSEPGLHEARSVVDIPVMGTMEAACAVANMMGTRFSLVQTDRIAGEYVANVIEEHGYGASLASVRWIGISACDLYAEKGTTAEEIQERTIAEARKCIQDDHAEVIVPGCTILGAILTDTAKELLESHVQVPVIDPMLAGLKMAEMMVELHETSGYPAVSRVGDYRRQPHREFEQLRQWMRQHDSPEQHYIPEKRLEYEQLHDTFVVDEADGAADLTLN